MSNIKPNNGKKIKKESLKKVITHKIVPKKSEVRALIIENVQNCFFNKGALGFGVKADEDDFIKKLNLLINLTEKNKTLYEQAGESGYTDKSKFKTGTRKPYYYDIIIFTQTANPPDHKSFLSHHFLRDPNKYRPFTEGKTKKKGKTYYKVKGHRRIDLLPDHALTDGSDSFTINEEQRRGIDFHPKLDISSLYRPMDGFSRNIFINNPLYSNRGFVLVKGGINESPYSAFTNISRSKTGLNEFLKLNSVSCITVCGLGRENSVINTLNDSLLLEFIQKRIILLDLSIPLNLENTKLPKDILKDTVDDNVFVKKNKKKGITTLLSDNVINFTESQQELKSASRKGFATKSLKSIEKLFF